MHDRFQTENNWTIEFSPSNFLRKNIENTALKDSSMIEEHSFGRFNQIIEYDGNNLITI